MSKVNEISWWRKKKRESKRVFPNSRQISNYVRNFHDGYLCFVGIGSEMAWIYDL